MEANKAKEKTEQSSRKENKRQSSSEIKKKFEKGIDEKKSNGKNQVGSSKTKKNMQNKPKVNELIIPRSKWLEDLSLAHYSKIDVIERIVKRLSGKQLEMFKDGPFGKYLGFKITRFPTKLMVHLIMRQCHSSDKNTLVFNLEGKIKTFGIREFALITGLNCHDYPPIDLTTVNEGEIKKKFFPIDETIERKNLAPAFNVGCDDDFLMVKLANLYFLESFLIPRQPHNLIENNHIRLLDDEESFKNYPWGRLCFDLTIQFIRKASDIRTSGVKGLQGFPYALVCWAYEIIPKLLDPNLDFVKRIGENAPRIVNWESTTIPSWKRLSEHVFFTDYHIDSFVATMDEINESYFQYFVNLTCDEVERKYREENEKKMRNEKEIEMGKVEEFENLRSEDDDVQPRMKIEIENMKTVQMEIKEILEQMVERGAKKEAEMEAKKQSLLTEIDEMEDEEDSRAIRVQIENLKLGQREIKELLNQLIKREAEREARKEGLMNQIIHMIKQRLPLRMDELVKSDVKVNDENVEDDDEGIPLERKSKKKCNIQVSSHVVEIPRRVQTRQGKMLVDQGKMLLEEHPP